MGCISGGAGVNATQEADFGMRRRVTSHMQLGRLRLVCLDSASESIECLFAGIDD